MKRPLHPLCVLIAALFAAACACASAAAGTATAAPPSMHAAAQPSEVARLKAFAKAIGVSCETTAGRLACIGGKPEVGDYYDVELHPGCGDDGSFGAVIAAGGAELRDRIAPVDRRTTARVATGQLLCIQATGRAGKHASYYYVRQVPPHSVAVCAGNAACDGYGDRLVRHSRKSQASCAMTPDGQPTVGCVAGWIRGEGVKRIANPKQ